VNVVSIVGARPEFVQSAMLSRALRARHVETLVHTGQHYDGRMSDRFFADLDIPEPEINLGVGSLPQSEQVAEMLRGVAGIIRRLDPDLVIVRGDTNSTLAGALAAKQLLVPLVHVEAGMRSYDRTMPEEINRVIVDHVADLQLVTDEAAKARLAAEGIATGVTVCGDVMLDIFQAVRESAHTALPPALRALAERPFDLLTLHRAENTDDRERLAAIVAGFADAPRPVLFPVHPRTAARLREFGLALPPAIQTVEPLGYREMVALECAARTILTDSGGVQREAYFAAVPCVTLRDTTEWTNTVDAGWNRLAGASTARIAAALAHPPERPATHPPLFGDGRAAHHIVAALEAPETAGLVRAARAVRAARGYAASEAAAGAAGRATSGDVTL
jgi:UDP-N-acetylglucosamine 2-epimerase